MLYGILQDKDFLNRITSYNVCYTKLLRYASDSSGYYTSLLERLRPPAESYQLDGSVLGYTGISDKESVMADLNLLSKNKKLRNNFV